MDEILSNAKSLLHIGQVENALNLLYPHFESNSENISFLQIFGEALLENNVMENAYDVLQKCYELDPQCKKGVNKVFYLGQIIGGRDGIQYIDIGLKSTSTLLNLVDSDKGEDNEILIELAKIYSTKEQLHDYLVKKINQGIFGKIEIWMTDLCMEPEAEDQCESSINYSLSLDPENPEALAILASIRISQQRPEDAKEALEKSWERFQVKKSEIEKLASKNSGDLDSKDNEYENGMEYLELTQPLLNLAKLAIELELYEMALGINLSIQSINDNILEIYYYEAISYLFMARQEYSTKHKSNDDYRDLELSFLLNETDDSIEKLMEDARFSLTQAYKIINSDSLDADPELVSQVSELVNVLGGPIMSELLPKKHDSDDEIESWEDVIENEAD